MPRIRTIKPEFWASEDVASVSREARLLFIGLLNFADDSGNGRGNPKGLKIKIFPGDDDVSVEDITRWLNELNLELITLYEVESKQYYNIKAWHHQRIDKPQKAKYPTTLQEDSKTIPRTLPPDRIVRDSKGGDSTVKDGEEEVRELPSLKDQGNFEKDLEEEKTNYEAQARVIFDELKMGDESGSTQEYHRLVSWMNTYPNASRVLVTHERWPCFWYVMKRRFKDLDNGNIDNRAHYFVTGIVSEKDPYLLKPTATEEQGLSYKQRYLRDLG